MIKRPLQKMCLSVFLVFILLAGNGLADENYDAETYGPEALIVWDHTAIASFDHKVHTMDAEIDCADCHDDLFEMESGAVLSNDNFTMQEMAEGQYCGMCHDGDTAFATDTNCIACHSVSEEPLVWDEPNQSLFSHKSHVEEIELECVDCHSEIFAMKKGTASAEKNFTMAAFKDGLYCGSCHNGEDAFDSAGQCESCHFAPTEKIIFTQPVKSVIFDHSIHVEKAKLSCESCHKEVFAMKQGAVENQDAILSDNPLEKRQYLVALHKKYCGTCHDSSQAFGYLTRCTVCHIGVKGLKEHTGEKTKKNGHE